jgi:hypothetical protein
MPVYFVCLSYRSDFAEKWSTISGMGKWKAVIVQTTIEGDRDQCCFPF